MRKFLIGTILSLTLVLGVTIAPSTIVKAAEPETAWKTWDYDTSNSISWWSANDHEAVQDGEYLYYATSGKQGTTDLRYRTIGTKLTYNGKYIYCGGGGASETLRQCSVDNTDYVMHQVPLSEIYNNLPEVKDVLITKRYVTLNLDPVYEPVVEGVEKASILGIRAVSTYAATTLENALSMPNEWGYGNWDSVTTKAISTSFGHTVTLRRPASLDPTAKTTPKNRGISGLTGIAKADIKAGDPLTGECGIK